VKIELVFERNTSCKSEYQGGEMYILLEKVVFSLVEETHVFVGRKPSM
jgi:hypothetical protein